MMYRENILRSGNLLALAVFVFSVFFCCDSVQAHSIKGRIKTDLSLAQPKVDDFAYFMESYVHNELYRHSIDPWQMRFYVRDFKEVVLSEGGKKAEVFFVRLDTKENELLDQSMIFERGTDKVWRYTDDTGEEVRVYTYMTKPAYYYQKYVFPLGSVAIAVLVCFYGVLVWRRKKGKTAVSTVSPPEGEVAGEDAEVARSASESAQPEKMVGAKD